MIGLAVFLLAGVVAASYLGAPLASQSVADYVHAVKQQGRWVHDVDSWHNPGRPSLALAAMTFLVWPVQQEQLMVSLALLGLISLGRALVRRDPAPFLTFGIFAPLAVVSWLNLDIAAAARYAIAYMAAHALLAADGVRVLSASFKSTALPLCAARCFSVQRSAYLPFGRGRQ